MYLILSILNMITDRIFIIMNENLLELITDCILKRIVLQKVQLW